MNEPLAQRLRPKTLDDYVGQEKAKGNLKVYLRAAQQRGDPKRWRMCAGSSICWHRGGCSAAPSRADAFPT